MRADEQHIENSMTDEYKVSYGRPPIHSRFQPGQSGNPNGRPAGRPNIKTMVDRVVHRQIPVRQDDGMQLMSLFEAVLFAVGIKGAKGDHRCASVFLKTVNDAYNQNHGAYSGPINSRPSAELFESLDPSLLSVDDKMELSRLAEIVDLAGGLLALSEADLRKARSIADKGHGKDVGASP